ncbi:Na+/H+ antiporter NhaA [Malaciobacter mytili LMG 24559]|uniref:Na(+)/H(+) antiporter NhaA n=1 Tax=Malaciobacter mytili LMG 24559 TaxID=1032238 RepID=A0AAX2AE22_9BACT|nr:Na+/H+ antiporter NhaA [Malaciobacter mytili]AXH15990.1 sodium:proton antiporter [Malaciobacter mytili LMG 24559]RXK13658.1 Na+/H+ antiporter NhaA [Malaciobacter mytili LMG 24559]
MFTIEDFIKKESSAGIVLIFVTIAALILKNTDFSPIYDAFLHTPVEIRFGALNIAKPLLLWINDGLMAIFFFLIGLEVKRELLEGHLSSVKQITLPAIAAVGGMVVPALVYVYFNIGDEVAMRGWAIPTATDIAFALGILSLLGSRVPVSLKIFLMALAIIDDLGAIVVIALFYTTDLSITSIVIASVALVGLIALNRFKVIKPAAYILLGVILWVSVLKSGVHATLAGVALAFTIPLKSRDENGKEFSMLKEMEHSLHYWVIFLILPLFAFVNAGVDLRNISINQLATSVPLGIMLGLFLGKQIGVFGFSYIAIKLKLATLPEGANFKQLYGVAILTGIGFTMSLFVDSLAFTDDSLFAFTDKLAILLGSFISGIFGYLVLKRTTSNSESKV